VGRDARPILAEKMNYARAGRIANESSIPLVPLGWWNFDKTRSRWGGVGGCVCYGQMYAPLNGRIGAVRHPHTEEVTMTFSKTLMLSAFVVLLAWLHQLDAIFSIFGASDRDKRLILQSWGLLKRL
jgi:hypothetical protein